jgi:hypothetical protein
MLKKIYFQGYKVLVKSIRAHKKYTFLHTLILVHDRYLFYLFISFQDQNSIKVAMAQWSMACL